MFTAQASNPVFSQSTLTKMDRPNVEQADLNVPRQPKNISDNSSTTKPRFSKDFGSIWAPIFVIVSRCWLTFYIILLTPVSSFCQYLALKCLAFTASISRCRRWPCLYNRPLERQFRKKHGVKRAVPHCQRASWSGSGRDLALKMLQGSIFIGSGSLFY